MQSGVVLIHSIASVSALREIEAAPLWRLSARASLFTSPRPSSTSTPGDRPLWNIC